jgi:hypothetical protein
MEEDKKKVKSMAKTGEIIVGLKVIRVKRMARRRVINVGFKVTN